MTDEQIKMLIRLTGEEARVLLEQGEECLYRDMQDQLVVLVRKYGVKLPLNCLQFLYAENEYARIQQPDMDMVPPF